MQLSPWGWQLDGILLNATSRTSFELIKLSVELGRDSTLVQAADGNTSV